MFSVMWSEHCSYKSSRPLLATLPTKGEDVVAGIGEQAGVIAIGDGLAVAFKIESHNHPSAVEPYQGAATGVGGILRDMFAMGARPIAVLDALRFGDPSDARTRHLVDGVVRGVGGYGNCVGRAHRGRGARVRPVIPGQPTGQRHGDRAARGRDAHEGLRGRSRQPGRAVRLGDGPGRDRRGVGPRQRHVRRAGSVEAAQRPGRRPVRGEAAHRGDAGDHRKGPGSRHPGPRRRRDHVRHLRDRGPRRHRDARRPRRDPAPGARPRAVRGHDLRVAGADGRHRGAGPLGGAAGRVRALGPAGGRSSAG